MSNDLIEKHKFITQFALAVYQSPLSVKDLKVKYKFTPDDELPDNLIQNTLASLPSVVADIYKETDRDKVLSLCHQNLELCEDTRLDVIWKKKVEKECRNRFRGRNMWKYDTIHDFNQAQKSNFKSFFHIFQLCKLIPSKQEELIEHVFANKEQKPGNEFNFVQIAGFTKTGLGLIVRKIPSIVMNLPGSKQAIIKPDMQYVAVNPVKRMDVLTREFEQLYPEYTRIQLNGAISSEINKQGFRVWWFDSNGKGKGNYQLIIDYY